MISKKYSHNFISMLKQSIKKTFGFSVFFTAIGVLYLMAEFVDNLRLVRYTKEGITAPSFFSSVWFDTLIPNFILIVIAVLTATLLFKFQWSKKECNVVYSLGMKRTEIFNAKVLGGILPMTASILILTVLQTLTNIFLSVPLTARYWVILALMVTGFLAIYCFTFLLCAWVFSGTGNVVEAFIFSAIIVLFPVAVELFLSYARFGYTLGTSDFIPNMWNWNEPFITSFGHGFLESVSADYFNKVDPMDPEGVKITIYQFSGAISAVVYSVVFYRLGIFTIKKRRNEIAGTWGRANGLTEVCTAMQGFNAFTAILFLTVYNQVNCNANLLTYIIGCIAFFVTIIIFKLIFSVKRKASIKKSLKLFPIYAAAIGGMILVFSFGFFGYADYIPENDKITKVTVYTNMLSYREDNLTGDSFYALNPLFGERNFNTFLSESLQTTVPEPKSVIFCNDDDISEITKLHKKIISDGKIKNNNKSSCSVPIYFKYVLEDGKTVTRCYYETNTETAKQIMKLNDLKTIKDNLADNLNLMLIVDKAKLASQYLGEEVYLSENDEVISKNTHEILGKVIDGADGEYYFVDLNGNEIYLSDLNYTTSNLPNITLEKCYIFSKDMIKGHCIGFADNELVNALQKDMLNQSATDYYMHTAENELGILSFGLSYTVEETVFDYDDDGALLIDYAGEEDTSEESHVDKYGNASGVSWNIFSGDIKAIVITKDMTNTIKYLKDHDMLKYFENTRTRSDIKSIKLANQAELFGKKFQSQNYPLFCASYWTSATVKTWDKESIGWSEHYFDKINNTITDVDTIQKLLDASVVFGYCDNDCRIMEITYADGSIGTVLIPAEKYAEIIK